MWSFHPDLIARTVPRYTSYPTAAEFGDLVGPVDLAHALDAVGREDAVSLYLHIPYCREICWYCGCNTGAANRAARLDAYLAHLHDEIDLVAARLGGRGRIGRIAFGGGSPNAIAPQAFIALAAHVRAAFGCGDAMLSVELDPRGFDAGWADAIAVAGTARASLGVQTFDLALQAAIGRVQPVADIRNAVDLLRNAGVGSINFDLMYGLPGQDVDALAATLDLALTMRPERLAVFGYAHVPHLIPRQRRIDARVLPDAAARFDQAQSAHQKLTRGGYRAIGFDHFAVPDDPMARAAATGAVRRNFQGFIDDPAGILIGLGASAISSFPEGLFQNAKNAGQWQAAIGGGQFATARGVRRTAEDRLSGDMIEAILCRGSAELDGLPDRAAIVARLAPFAARGLIRWRGTCLELAQDALPYGRAIAAMLDPWRNGCEPRLSQAV